MPDELLEDAPLTAEEILTFGPCVESVVHTVVWLQEKRAPIAVAAGKPKLGKVFDDQGLAEAVVIRPCMSRGRRVRGLPPVYTPTMLEANSGVFNGWPMFMDHVPPELVSTMAKHGRSVKELGGQVIKGRWSRDYVHEDDRQYGYQKGATIAQVWGRPLLREMVGENPNLLHTSINAWPTSGKPGPVPWQPKIKGMVIEGIRRTPQGSVDFVVRGGAGGRLLLAESLGEGEPDWPAVGEWEEEDKRFVVSLAESFYASRQMTELTLPTKPDELKAWLQEHAPHLVPALQESATLPAPGNAGGNGNGGNGGETVTEGISEDRVRELLAEASSGQPTVDEFEQRLQERTTAILLERDEQRELSAAALELIRVAEGIPDSWKADLRTRYSLQKGEASGALLYESADLTDAENKPLTPEALIESRVKADLLHIRELLAEARGKPRPRGEGARSSSNGDGAAAGAGARGGSRRDRPETPHWRRAFAGMKIVESEDKAMELYGAKVED